MFDANDRAFAPMYDECIGVRGVRCGKTVGGQYAACVFDLGLCDPMSGIDASNARGVVRILVPRSGPGAWIGGKPQVGDVVTLPDDGRKFKVSHVSLPLGADWEMEAREA